jgi:hypothetical protein
MDTRSIRSGGGGGGGGGGDGDEFGSNVLQTYNTEVCPAIPSTTPYSSLYASHQNLCHPGGKHTQHLHDM